MCGGNLFLKEETTLISEAKNASELLRNLDTISRLKLPRTHGQIHRN